jgi:hypothetical protein
MTAQNNSTAYIKRSYGLYALHRDLHRDSVRVEALPDGAQS